ncbi:MAG TPA: hypothetical protein DIU15_05320 [Deltaproteobacteria bacterium]|mgnify:CR=1 FL=1|nr:hypothetical protein [Deltaproteobacteria bacterium]HCP45438.1 hypothetical protein [Deltaproteobacteria bacterium]
MTQPTHPRHSAAVGNGPGPGLVPAALLGALVAISFAAIFFRQAMPTDPLVSAGIRLAVASVVLLPLAVRSIVRNGLDLLLVRWAAVGGLLYGVHFGAWVASLERTTVAASVTLVTATPLLLAIVALFTGRDRPNPKIWWALGLAAVGITTIGGTDLGNTPEALLGDALALLGMAAMAGYLLIGRHLGERLDLWVFSGVATAVGAVALLSTAAALGIPLEPASDSALVALVLSALVPQLIGHNLLTWALRYAKPTTVGMATVGEPVGATALGVLLLGEVPSLATVVGCLITLSAVGMALRLGQASNPTSSEPSSEEI